MGKITIFVFISLFMLSCSSGNTEKVVNTGHVALVTAFFGGVVAFLQWKKNMSFKRAEFLNQIFEKFYSADTKMTDTWLLVRQKKDDVEWFNKEKGFINQDNEHKIDEFLSYLSYICYLINTKNILEKESKLFKYILSSTCKSDQVKLYFEDIFERNKRTECLFQPLIDYGVNHGYLPEDTFKIKESKKRRWYFVKAKFKKKSNLNENNKR